MKKNLIITSSFTLSMFCLFLLVITQLDCTMTKNYNSVNSSYLNIKHKANVVKESNIYHSKRSTNSLRNLNRRMSSKDFDALGDYHKNSLETVSIEVTKCTDTVKFKAEFIPDLTDYRVKKQAYYEINVYGISMFDVDSEDLMTNSKDTKTNEQAKPDATKKEEPKKEEPKKVEPKKEEPKKDEKKPKRLYTSQAKATKDPKINPDKLIHRVLLSSITRVPSLLLGAKGCISIDSGSVTAEMTICFPAKLKAEKVITVLNKFERCRSGDNLVEIPQEKMKEIEKMCGEQTDKSLTLKNPANKKNNLKTRPGNKWDEMREKFLHPHDYVVPGAPSVEFK